MSLANIPLPVPLSLSRVGESSADITVCQQAEVFVAGQSAILERIARGEPLRNVLEALLHFIEAQAPGMIGSVLLLDPDGVHVRHGASPSLPEAFTRSLDGLPIGEGAGSCGTAAFRREPVIVADIAADPLWAGYRDAALDYGLRACWSTPIFDAAGRVLGTFAIYYRQAGPPAARDQRLVDVATHLASVAISHDQKEAAIRAGEDRYHATLDNMLEGCQLIGFDWRYLYLNRAAAGHNRRPNAELLGQKMTETWPGIEATGVFALLRRCMDERIALHEEVEFDFADGTRGWFDMRSQPVPEGIFVLSIDVTERKDAERALRQAQKMEAIGTLAGGIAHDFNNVLAAIRGYAELAKKEAVRPIVVEHLNALLSGSDRAIDLVRQMLAFSRRQELERKPVQLRPVVEEALKLLRATIPATIAFETSFAFALPDVLADTTQLHQIVMNLGTNAAHAMKGRPGKLTVNLEASAVDAELASRLPGLRPGAYVRLSVSDTGQGMDRATLDRIFEPFFTTKAPGEGTGLGLAVVHGIMQSHEGAVGVYSRSGEGTTFHLYFPAR